jgi:DNA (cytosine-5)-methyltransferase 1
MSHVDSTSPVTHVSLCAGYGGIDLGLHRAIPNLRTIAVSEIEAFACANLVAKMEAGLLDPAPIWTDLKTFPWAEFRDRVDILSGGYPCQPFSAAGKRLGAEDPRHLWPFISAGIAAMRPSACFFENVDGHISMGLPDVLQDLAGLGYRATWCVASASECGAPHQRKRVFILAHNQRQRIEELGRQIAVGSQQHSAWDLGVGWRRVSFASECHGGDDDEPGNECAVCGLDYCDDCQCPGPTQDGYEYAEFDGILYARPEHPWPSRPGEQQHAWEPPRVVVDAKGQRAGQRSELRSEECGSGSALSWDVEQSDQAMGNANELRSQGRHDAGSLQAMGISRAELAGANGKHYRGPAESSLGRNPARTTHRLGHAELYTTCDNRTDELRLLGNGVVPACAERAFRLLVGELAESESGREPANG